MKKAFFLTLLLIFRVGIFAQNGKNDTESDSLFKAFLAKSKGIKFDEPKTQPKDTAKVTVSATPKSTSPPNKDVKALSSKVDSPNRAKPIATNKSDSSLTSKKDTSAKVSTTVKSDTKPGLHKFKDYNNTYALEAERKGPIVKLYLKMDDIEQYAEVILVRSQAELGNFSDVRHIQVIKGANKFEYVETEDRYPLPTKVGAAYKIRAITKDGAIRMFPAITLEPGNK
ncbi:MAG: hypothetical protein JNL95_11950 [Chitinophagales bacterium]|nr:hypothetical protein [Chitinophagales bacterium]